MTLPGVYPILDLPALQRVGMDAVAAAGALLEGGAEILQFRCKSSWTREIYKEAGEAVRLCREAGAVFIVNDRADIAALLDAGLHVGQDDLAPRDARLVLGCERPLGYSTHNGRQLAEGGGEPVDYLAIGPIFGTASKENPDPVVGVEELARIAPLAAKPLVAIGGITRDNAAAVWAAGAASVAVIGDLYPQPCTARALRERMEEWRQIARK